MNLTEEDIQELGKKIIEVLTTIYDPEIPVNIYDLGLIYDVEVSLQGQAKIIMTLTAPNCPAAESLPAEVKQKVEAIEAIKQVEVIISFEPTWTKDMMSEDAKFELGLL